MKSEENAIINALIKVRTHINFLDISNLTISHFTLVKIEKCEIVVRILNQIPMPLTLIMTIRLK